MKHRTIIALSIALAASIAAAGFLGYDAHRWKSEALAQHDAAVKAVNAYNAEMTKYNAFVKYAQASCDGVLDNTENEPFDAVAGCFFGRLAHYRDFGTDEGGHALPLNGAGMNEGEVVKEAQVMFTSKTDQATRDFVNTEAHHLFAEYSHYSAYEVQGAVRSDARVWMALTNHQ
jgi:hypothetical protein